jgi:hypothetical protein
LRTLEHVFGGCQVGTDCVEATGGKDPYRVAQGILEGLQEIPCWE